MIKANELRIGNYVDYWRSGHNRLTKVENISEHGINFEDNDPFTADDLGNLTGIKLTEEFLLKIGFEEVIKETGPPINDEVKSFRHVDEDFEIMQLHRSDKWMLCDYHKNTARFQFVHQLQNLYFALSGEELEIPQPI